MRDRLVHSEEVYNIFRAVQRELFRKDDDEKLSVRAWMHQLSREGFTTYEHPEYEEKFSFGFLSPKQRDVLRRATAFCLDATHNTSSSRDALLYTVVVRHPDTGVGYPVAWLYTRDQTAQILCDWLLFLRDCGLANPAKITIDCSHVEVQALGRVFPHSPIQWCVFHVVRAWWSNIRQRVKAGSTQESNMLQKRALGVLKGIMWERSRDAMENRLHHFRREFSQDFPDFVSYFERTWVINNKIMFWAVAHQPAIYTNMETNNYVESWHNQLKSIYLKRHPNRRVDRLVYILTNDVLKEYEATTTRLMLGLGRTRRLFRGGRSRSHAADAADAITSVGEMLTARYHNNGDISAIEVNSFTQGNLTYHVSVANRELRSCDCESFRRHNDVPCKHMYLCTRKYTDLSVVNRE